MQYFTVLDFFQNPVLVTSTIGCILVGVNASIMGTILFVQRYSLLSETLSHASYPGMVLSVLLMAPLIQKFPNMIYLIMVVGGFISTCMGMHLVNFLIKECKVSQDCALTFTLSTFLGVGALVVSRMQFLYPTFYQQIKVMFYGQATTIKLFNVYLYCCLTIVIIFFIYWFFNILKNILFDPVQSSLVGINCNYINQVILVLTSLSIILGMQSIGMLMTVGMFIAPASSARQFTDKLSTMLILSVLFGVVSAFLGNYLSINLSIYIANNFGHKANLPTGPSIVIVAVAVALFSLVFANRYGILPRYVRQKRFEYKVLIENSLKYFYKSKKLDCSWWVLFLLWAIGYITHNRKLTKKGLIVATKVLKKHRLWEVYLCSIGIASKDVHKNAEDMEHVISSDMASNLNEILDKPKKDPHGKDIEKL